MLLKNQYQNPEGNPYLWDAVVMDTVRREDHIDLYLNTDVREVRMKSSALIESVSAWQMGSERRFEFRSPLFADCSGDGLVGFLAGAEFRRGREARSEYGEDLAAEQPDEYTLGSSLYFYSKDVGVPVPFVAPSFAKDITATSLPTKRVIRTGMNGCDFWWIEWGGELDTIRDNERIRDELWAVVYGVWDYIKNSGKFPEAATHTLEWVGAVPGKRESRRFVGDLTLTQNDILAQRAFDDAVGYGGWSIDIHPPLGMYAYETASTHVYSDGVYPIPYRCLYSRNISNLFFAGRNISASHIAFGSTRVMATCAVLGEALGTAAHLCLANGCSPRGLYEDHTRDLVQQLLKQDAALIGVKNQDELDLAPGAALTSSSSTTEVRLCLEPQPYIPQEAVAFSVMGVAALNEVELLCSAKRAGSLTAEVYGTSRGQNYIPAEKYAERVVEVAAGTGWLKIPTAVKRSAPETLFVVLKGLEETTLFSTHQTLFGVQSYRFQRPPERDDPQYEVKPHPLESWRALYRQNICFAIPEPQSMYCARQVVNGYRRPFSSPNLWLAAPGDPAPWLELRWNTAQPLRHVQVILNDNVNEDLNNLHQRRTPHRVMPELVTAYVLECERGGRWDVVATVTENRQRRLEHNLGGDYVEAVRLSGMQTSSGLPASVVEVRAYA